MSATVLIGGKPVAAIERRAREATRSLQAAHWRGSEACYLRERIRRLGELRARLVGWCDANPEHRMWSHRNRRARICHDSITTHYQRITYLTVKVDALVKDAPDRQQGQVSAAYFQALNQPPPRHRHARTITTQTGATN